MSTVERGLRAPTRPARYPAQRASPEAATEVFGAVADSAPHETVAETEVFASVVETEVLEPVADAGARAGEYEAPAEAAVPLAPPVPGGRLRFLGGKHARLRVAGVAVLVLGSAIGITVGVVGNKDPDKVQVTNDLQADPAGTAVPTPGPSTRPTEPTPEEAALIAQRQQDALDAAQSRAASKAAAARADAVALAKDAERARASRATPAEPVPSAPVDCDTYSGAKATGCALLAEFDFSTTQMDCLDKLWTRESHWTTTAENPSGAYGIPQALPGSKMSSVADDWKTNPATQIRWGLGYIKGRYGTPCDAWAYFGNNGSY